MDAHHTRAEDRALVDESSLNHVPEDHDAFTFDKSVADVFPDMARRSIPNYELAHRIHADMIVDHLSYHQHQSNWILDVGASRGALFDYLEAALADRRQDAFVDYQGVAVDNSGPMLEFIERNHPHVARHNVDLSCEVAEPEWHSLITSGREYMVVNAMYTLQFLRPDMQMAILAQLRRVMHRDGLLFLGTKVDVAESFMGSELHKAYIHFRIRNGYKIEDINAKSQALRGSMFPPTMLALKAMLLEAGLEILASTTTAMVFCTLVCRKTLTPHVPNR